ncbi:DUF2788 domain-containing protein, partial [Oleiphilus sp. HI0117]|uniref:DUF2788 domain-containing protein n=2 Tax=Oleiphilus TaxID=141450 RepID=UPI000AD1B625
GKVMSVEQFESISLYVLVTALILYMGYIVWDLAKRSNAGKFGTFILFFALGLGVFGFVAKTVIVEMMNL